VRSGARTGFPQRIQIAVTGSRIVLHIEHNILCLWLIGGAGNLPLLSTVVLSYYWLILNNLLRFKRSRVRLLTG
jgi:hypothetical protein